MRDLASRLREIVRRENWRVGGGAQQPAERCELTYVPDPDPFDPCDDVALALGGVPVDDDPACIAIEHRFSGDQSHGRKTFEASAPSSAAPLHLLDSRCADLSDWARRVVFFDIETTGLGGGAGTIAFLAGCGWFDASGFVVKQFFLAGPSGERTMLRALGEIFAGASLIVTYNGRTFDLPFMETRWAFHRTASGTDDVPHFDMLPTSRRLWGRREMFGETSCSLSALERAVLGVHRISDVPGFEIPARYFQFLRTAQPGLIRGVLDHNCHDITSLAVLMAHALWLVSEGPMACREPAEQLALGRLYERAGDPERAEEAFVMAAGSSDAGVRRQALSHLALRRRRQGCFVEAAALWQQVLDLAPADPADHVSLSPVERQAAEALAIHHEHRVKNPVEARRFATLLRAPWAGKRGVTRAGDVEHRLARLDKKIGNLKFEN